MLSVLWSARASLINLQGNHDCKRYIHITAAQPLGNFVYIRALDQLPGCRIRSSQNLRKSIIAYFVTGLGTLERDFEISLSPSASLRITHT